MPKPQKRKASKQKSRKTSKRQKTSTLKYPGAGASLGSVLGGALGGAPGAAIGSALGGGLHSLVHAVTGLGDYSVDSNTLLMDGAPIHIVNNPNSGVIVRHREYIQDIISSSTPGQFKLEAFNIQPGDGKTFPWLAAIAENFQEYKMRGMLFEFKSLSADALNSTNTALGSVILATNYNPVLPNFTNKFEMEQYQFVTNGRPSINLVHPIECAPSETPLEHLYIRTGEVQTGLDPRFYDFGKFQIATTGMQGASVNVGELWVSYEIELFKPRASPTGVAGAMGSAWATDATPASSVTTLFDGIAPISTSTCAVTFSGNTITLPDAPLGTSYLIAARISGDPTSISTGVTTYTNCTAGPVFGGQAPINGNSSGAFIGIYNIIVTGPSPSITLTGSGYPTSEDTGSRSVYVTCWDKQVNLL